MTASERTPRVYTLTEGVRIFRNADEIRFRRGVWSFNEAILRLGEQGERVARFFTAVYERLIRNEAADADAIGRETGATPEEIVSYCDVLESLVRQQFLHDAQKGDVARVVSALLGGNLSGFEDYIGTPRPVLFFGDTPYARGAAKTIAKEVGLPVDILDEGTVAELARADLTTRTDAVQHAETAARLGNVLNPYCCVLGCLSAPDLSVLRNLNRLLIEAEKPLILGMIDGPFLSLLSTHATRSGCFECFEQRLLARLEDTQVYHQFAVSASGGAAADRTPFAPALHTLTAAVVSEGYLYATLTMSRLVGRIVNVYLPLLEIQVQDLLRVPYCPACGFISKARMQEMYTSSKRLVSEMLAKVELEE